MNKSMLAEINHLRELTVAELQVEWQRLYGEPSRSRNKDYLWRRLAWRVQELAHGGLGDRAKARVAELGAQDFARAACVPTGANVAAVGAAQAEVETVPPPRRYPRLPTPGTVLTRQYHGREIRVVTLDSGFEWDGRHYGSLSKVARAVTGQHWSGPLFFGLRGRKRKA